MATIYSDLHRNILDQFNEAGVEIMSPVYEAGRDGNKVAIPDSYLKAGTGAKDPSPTASPHSGAGNGRIDHASGSRKG